MIHQVIASPLDVQRLNRLVDFQIFLIDFAANNGDVTPGNLAAQLATFFGANAPNVLRWIVDNPTIISELHQFAIHPNVDEKRALIAGIRFDINLLSNPRPTKFQIIFDEKPPDWKKGLKDLFIWFYDRWGKESSFPSELFLLDHKVKTIYTRWDFIDNFSEINPKLYLCTMCDAVGYRTRVNNKTYASIEHFFPKSIYPHLALHPYNLVPICTYCNSVARDKDILSFCSNELGITHLMLPYRHEKGLDELAYIEMVPVTDRNHHPLEIRILSSKGANSQNFIDLFEKIYAVQNRWNDTFTLEKIEQQVFRRITQFLFGDIHLGNNLSDLNFLIQKLELLMAITSKDNLGVDPFGFTMIWFLKYHIKTLNESNTKAPIYLALTEWAETQQKNLQYLRNHVKELYSRMT
jgi:hypothetical protein